MMREYAPLVGLTGTQVRQDSFRFSWKKDNSYYGMKAIWIYMENNPNPMKVALDSCMDDQTEISYGYLINPMTEIKKMRFLIFLTPGNKVPPDYIRAQMAQSSDYICEVSCGFAEVTWNFIPDSKKDETAALIIQTNKKIPRGLLCYAYHYGGVHIEFEIPGSLDQSICFYQDIHIPAGASPMLQTRTPGNISIQYDEKLKPPKKRKFFSK